jgi:hypothetical protein
LAYQLSLYFLGGMDGLFGGTPEEQERIRKGEANTAAWQKKVAAAGEAKSGAKDSPGFMGPAYSFADELPVPGEIGVRAGGDPGAIFDAAAGVNYYVDAIGFGQKTMFNFTDMQPLGLRYFISTGATCSNGALMWEYVDTTPKGDILGQRVDKALGSMGLPRMRGLAPGILEDARDALNPMPIFRAAMGSGYPKCTKVTLPVGDLKGNIRSPYDQNVQWIKGHVDPGPAQTKWVHAKDGDGNPIFMNSTDYQNEPKIYYPDGSPIEGFENPAFWEKYIDKRTMAGLMFAGVVLGVATYAANK